MAKTPSAMIPLGSSAPSFSLPNPKTSAQESFSDLRSDKGTVVMFICNHCPYVIHIEEHLVRLAKDYSQKGISFIAISSNDVENYPDDSPEKMKEKDYPFSYLYDESQEVAKAYGAECTPDFFVYSPDSKLVYRGQFDDSRPKSDIPVTGADLAQALDCLLSNEQIPEEAQKPSLGCNIKWKA